MAGVPDLGDVREVDGLWLSEPFHMVCFRHKSYKPNRASIQEAFEYPFEGGSWGPEEKLLCPLTLTDW